MTPKLPSKTESVRVVVRCRPLDAKEKGAGHKSVVEMDQQQGLVEVSMDDGNTKSFSFDSVYGPGSKQKDIYDETFRELVQAVLEGFNGTIFAYGQTGTGKTFTMQGVKGDPELKGVIPNSFHHIYDHISQSKDQQYLVRASYLEIYMEEIRDLLQKDQTKRLELKEKPDVGVYVKELTSYVTKDLCEIEGLMDLGNRNRSVGATNMNEQSSRSHAIFIITVECGEIGLDNDKHYRVGKLNLVDLAGSERQSKTGAEGDRLKEATKINLSLSALGNVISALVDGKSSHIPYRDSKLTRLLQDSLGGNSKTVMVANIGPANYNVDETLTTLRYASRAKNIKNKPKINEDPKDALLRKYQEELCNLKKALANSGVRLKNKLDKAEDDDEDENDEDCEDESTVLMREKEKLEQEKQQILNNNSLIAEEKQKLLVNLTEKEKALQKERETQKALIEAIQKRESKLLTGDKGIIDHTNEQQKALELRRKEIAEEKKREREIKQKLDEQEETALNLTETYNSSQQEAEVKTKKLKKLFAKLQSTRTEIQDIQEVNRKERQELEKTLNELVRELKLKSLIIDNFIPPEEKTKIMSKAYYDENNDAWKLKPSSKQVTETVLRRPQCFSSSTSMSSNKMDPLSNLHKICFGNFLQVELDLPSRTTQDYEEPAVAPKIQAILNSALVDEGDIDINTNDHSNKIKAKTSNKPSNIKKPQKHSDSNYPKSRGLVYK